MMYNATATLAWVFGAMDEAESDQILDDLAAYHPAIGASINSDAEIVITLPADDLTQAVRTAIAVFAPYRPVGLEVLTTQTWDKRAGISHIPDLLSVAQVAERQNISRQAVLQKIGHGTLPAQRVGQAWAVPVAAL